MTLVEFIHRASPQEPRAEEAKIPWHDPDFSRCMLHAHLTQAHDAASRRQTSAPSWPVNDGGKLLARCYQVIARKR